MALNWQKEYHRYRKYFSNLGSQKKTRTYAAITFSFLAITFFLFFAIKPTITTITLLLRQIKDQELVAEKLQVKINTLKEAQDEYLTIESDLHLINEALPLKAEVSSLVKQIEALARKSGVTLETIRYNQAPLMGEEIPETDSKRKKTAQEEKEVVKTPTVNFVLSASGDYPNLKSFLRSLSSLRRIILIESFSFKTGKTEGQPLVLNLNASAHYLKASQDKK